MEYVILIGVVAVLGLSALYGYKKGFIHILLSMVAMLVTFVLAAVLTAPVSAMLKSVTPLYDNIESSVGELVTENSININSIEKLGLPSFVEDKIVEESADVVGSINEYIITTVSETLLKALTFFVLIIVIYIIVRIVIVVFDFVSKLPVINSINKVGGLAVGLIHGLLIVWIGCLVVTAFGDKAWAQEALTQINDNQMLTFIYNNNPIVYIISKFI